MDGLGTPNIVDAQPLKNTMSGAVPGRYEYHTQDGIKHTTDGQ
jgi:hypothetical protein